MASLQPQESVPGQAPSAQEIQRKLSVAQRKASLVSSSALYAPSPRAPSATNNCGRSFWKPKSLRAISAMAKVPCDAVALHLLLTYTWEAEIGLTTRGEQGKGRIPIPQGSGTDTEDELSIQGPNSNDTAPGNSNSQPLSAIAEHALSGPDESDEEEDVAGGWRPAGAAGSAGMGNDKSVAVLHSGYLWKKGSGPRKTWKKRWFVLRPTHLACYKTSAEYKLLRLLDLVEMHAVTPVQLKRHPNTCGIVTQARTFYFQAQTSKEIEEWVTKLNEAREALRRTNPPSPTPVVIVPPPSDAVPIPNSAETMPAEIRSKSPPRVSVVVPGASPPSVTFTEPVSPISTSRRNAPTGNTSSDSEDDVSPSARQASSSKDVKDVRELGKPIISGYLMKAGELRKTWRKRWFVLTPTKLVYMSSHMDAKPHRQIPLSQIIDAFEYKTTTHGHKHGPLGNEPSSAPHESASNAASTSRGGNSTNNALSSEYGMNYIFKVVTPKKTLALSAPSEEEEVKWISAIRALIARRAKEKEAEVSVTTGGHAKEGSKEKEKESEAATSKAGALQGSATDDRKRHGSKTNEPPSSSNNASLATTTTSTSVGTSAPARGAPPL
ncbi:related to tandem ph domain-containing protein-2 (tapp2) [Serendipita indica DSM 11827]|uniref:Related to tandem ph domain-containing protein-2 (Tapp2) n=1 Tax=Serendipita indica (strain DSM 11827) TaxID=1109443 RepID=G4T6W7_SERID|nr:related to tandem ph domain-containing protein-2 (tapp2) [Serendipita indica DSM 11827]